MNDLQSEYFDPYTVLYGFVLFMIDWINNYLTYWFIAKRNFRYRKDYNNALTHQLMMFKLFNYFLPLCYVAFYKRSFLSVFTLNISMLVLGEMKSKISIWFKPMFVNFYRNKWFDPENCKEKANTIFHIGKWIKESKDNLTVLQSRDIILT